VGDDVELDGRPLLLCLNAVIYRLLRDDSFTDVAFAIFDKFKCQCFELHVTIII